MNRERVVAWVLFASAAATIGLSAKATYDSNQVNDRLCSYIRENARVTKIRSDAAVKRDTAEDDLLDGTTKLAVKASKGHPMTAFDRLASDYQKQASDLAAERARNPLPAPPTDC